MAETPTGTTNIQFSFRSRAQTAPTIAKQVILKLFTREIVDNSVPSAWTAGTVLTGIDITNTANWLYDSQTISLATLSLTAGRTTQYEMTRDATHASDTLVGDWDLAMVKMNYS
jgi:hypothetical protein